MEWDIGDNKYGKYKIEAICDSAVYIKESAGHLPELYYLVFWKNCLKKKIPISFI